MLKLIVLLLLMMAGPILNMAGLVELQTLFGICIGFAIGIVFAALPDGPERRDSGC